MEAGDIQKKLEELEAKIDAIYISAEKTRKYFLWTMIGGIATFVLPLIGLALVIPYYVSLLKGSIGSF